MWSGAVEENHLPKLHYAVSVAALVVASAFAPAQHLRHACRAPRVPPPEIAATLSESVYGGGVALAVGGIGLIVRLRRR